MVTQEERARAGRYGVCYTSKGTAYLQAPQVVLMGHTINLDTPGETMAAFLAGFDSDLRFASYLEDDPYAGGAPISPMDLLPKVAGQLCYLSHGPGHTPHELIWDYLRHIKESGQGSVMEHASASFLCWGVSRSLTHELVHHQAGMAYSQVSQRYCGGSTLRFVERPEFVGSPSLHAVFEAEIDRVAALYESLCDCLVGAQASAGEILRGDTTTEQRKKVRGAARAYLPNCTEAPILVTANLRVWRHFLEMWASQAADVEIRRLAILIYRALVAQAPAVFGDYDLRPLSDGTYALETPTRKV